MQKSERIKKPTHKEFEDWLGRSLRKSALVEGLTGIAGIVFSLLGGLLSLYVSTSDSPNGAARLLSHGLLYFVGGITLLGMIIVGIAVIMRRKNREVINLKRRLSEIYLLALRKSALNPQAHVDFE